MTAAAGGWTDASVRFKFNGGSHSDPSKKGTVGFLTDIRDMRGESTGVNLFVQGAIEAVGRIVASIEEARDVLRAWR